MCSDILMNFIATNLASLCWTEVVMQISNKAAHKSAHSKYVCLHIRPSVYKCFSDLLRCLSVFVLAFTPPILLSAGCIVFSSGPSVHACVLNVCELDLF